MLKLSCILIVLSVISIIKTDIEKSNLSDRNRTYMLFVSEDVPIGHTQIIDTFDSSFCSSYSIKSHQYHRHDLPFEIQLNTNESCILNLHVIRSLDREQTPMYTIRKQLINENTLNDQDQINIQLSIVILDVNDHVPQFESEHFHFVVSENLPAGSLIGRIQAHDPDIFLNGKISYTLFGHDLIQDENRTMFRIDKDTGELFLLEYELDYETKKEYTLMVEAKDHGDSEATLWPSVPSYADITITVEDVNDQKPQISFTMPNEDRQDGNIQFMNLSNSNLNFEQDRLLQSFRSISTFFDANTEFIHLTKEEPLPAEMLLGLFHLRDNDQTSNGQLSLELYTYIRCSTEGLNLDNHTLCRASDLFRLSVFRPNVYGLFTNRMLDRDEYENYILHFIANDNGDRPIRSEQRRLSSRQSSTLNIDDFLKLRVDQNFNSIQPIALQSDLIFFLTLSDINDNAPRFDQIYFHIEINENQPKNTPLTRLHARDIDKGKNGSVRYELIVKDRPEFSLDARTGILRMKQSLDREQCELYRVGIRAHDLGSPNRKYSSIALVDIQVKNVNDHVPYFLHDVYHFDIQENLPIGTIVGRLTIGDRDEQEPIEKVINLSSLEDFDLPMINLTKSDQISSTIEFLFVDTQQNESLSNLFSIDSQGFLRTIAILDRELKSDYNLSIYIYDSKLKLNSLPTTILVQILDENDNLPYEPFLSNPFDISVEQINNNPTIIYEFQPIDLDQGPNGQVSIECLNCSSTSYFHLNTSSNATILMTNVNQTIPDGTHTLAFLLRDHGKLVARERIYTLTFNLTHRLIISSNENDEQEGKNLDSEAILLATTTIIIPPIPSSSFLVRQKNFFAQLFLHNFQWHFLILLILCWLVLVCVALWTCYRYDRIARRRQKEKQQQQEQFEIQVRQHEIVHSPELDLPKSLSLANQSEPFFEKEILSQDDDEIEDTSYDADHIITDANFVLTSGCATNESNLRYLGNSSGVHFGYLPSNNNLSANLNSIAIRNHHSQLGLHTTSFSRLQTSCSRCQLSSSMMNSRETMLTDAATNTSFHEEHDNDEVLKEMNTNNRMLYENASTILHNDYQFEPIDHDFPSIDISTMPSSAKTTPYQTTDLHLLKRPIPVANYHSNSIIERSQKKYHNYHSPQQQTHQYVLSTKRNSSIHPSDIDSTSRSYTLPRSITTDQIGSNQQTTTTNRLYYYPSVQDVLDALNRRSFDKESFV